MKKISFILLILFLAIPFLTACGEGGTDTGNPTTSSEGDTGDTGDSGSNGGDNPVSADATPTGAVQISVALCSVLTPCYTSLSETNCEAGVLAATNLVDEFGLSTADYADLQAVSSAEAASTIAPNSTLLTTCLDNIDALTCTNAGVLTAYNPSNPNNFENVEDMIPAGTDSCGGVY